MHASELTLLLNLGFIVITAAGFAFLGKLVKMPSIVAYIIAGMALGPGLGIVQLDHSLELISELGIALLLFLVGLELSLQKIKDLGRVAIILGGLQVPMTASGAYVISTLMGFSVMECVFLAATMTFSSTVVVIKLLDQKGATRSTLWAHRDLSFSGTGYRGYYRTDDFERARIGGGESFEMVALTKSLGIAFAGMVILLLVSLFASRYVLPRPFAWASRSPDTVFIWALCWCFSGRITSTPISPLGRDWRFSCQGLQSRSCRSMKIYIGDCIL